ncbi:hypothetical protein GHT06_005950 [Daphnia sinensis]|uniref:Uncharacterized protein n=1 Tax=Daphnia sinensis TaxID=1820382 RepID=A0AAD5PMV1_9CRUS|nr:hypothetical protein GHT06_005022 [Daphnia sinensis]KAI9551173.1 hypothetical protein GHT06_005950 [Daphnia sinensis]
MAIIINEKDDPEQADWMDEGELDLEGIVIQPEISTRSIAMPVVSMGNHLSTPWEEATEEED